MSGDGDIELIEQQLRLGRGLRHTSEPDLTTVGCRRGDIRALQGGEERGLGDLRRNGQRLVERDRSLADAIGESRSLDQLHHQRDGPGRPLQPEDVRDVRVVERGEDFGFALKSSQTVGIGRYGRGQHFDGDLAP